MRWTYSCPHCSAMLNPDETVVLLATRGDTRLLVGFHPQPGNYEVHLPPGSEAEPGSRWDFFCPVCHARLVTEDDDQLCAVDMESRGQKHRLFFSPISGEKATFVVGDDGEREHFGSDFLTYVQAVGWGPRLR